jgi:ferrochelatase
MPRYAGEPVRTGAARIGVLLVNLGTPDAPTSAAVRRYLAQFLSDPRVVEIPPLLWWPILYGVVLTVRPRRSAAAYREIWTDAGSPLLVNTAALARALQTELADGGAPVTVAYGMRYGNPPVADALRSLRNAGASRLLVLPLYPQYAAATTGSAFDAVTAELRRWRRVPEACFIGDYHDCDGYVSALAASVREHWSAAGRTEKLLLSFHGLPARCSRLGDPYERQCRTTARLLAAALGLEGSEGWSLSFQSRVGREPWLEPYTDVLLAQWARDGVRRVQVLCPGFAVDCLETLEEIALRNRRDFIAAGGEELEYIPALNARPDHVAFLAALARLRAWPGGGADPP